MGLDPSLFLQASALRQQQHQKLADTFGKIFEEKEKQGFDIDKLVEPILVKKASGQELSPEENAIGMAYDLKNSAKTIVNPKTGEYEKANQPIFGLSPQSPQQGGFDLGALPNGPGNIGAQGQGSNPALTTPYDKIPPLMDMDQASVEAQLAGTPADGQTLPPQLPKPPGLDTGFMGPPQIPVNGSNVAARQEQMKANTDLMKRAGEADIKASEVGAETRSKIINENAANKDLKKQGLEELLSNIDMLIKDAEGTPSGALEGGVAKLSSFLGKPNPQAVKGARFSSGAAISGLQTRIEFLKGQGTITDAEAKQAMSFIPGENDPYEIKIEKLKAGKDYINSLIGSAPAAPSGPGFKYIGVKK